MELHIKKPSCFIQQDLYFDTILYHMPQGDKEKNYQIYGKKVTKGQICDGSISKMHVMRSTTYLKSPMLF